MTPMVVVWSGSCFVVEPSAYSALECGGNDDGSVPLLLVVDTAEVHAGAEGAERTTWCCVRVIVRPIHTLSAGVLWMTGTHHDPWSCCILVSPRQLKYMQVLVTRGLVSELHLWDFQVGTV